MVDLTKNNGDKEASDDIIKEKDAQIKQLQADLAQANYMVVLLQQENMKLKQTLGKQSKTQEIPLSTWKSTKDKGKAIIDIKKQDKDTQVQPRRPTNRAMAKKGQQT